MMSVIIIKPYIISANLSKSFMMVLKLYIEIINNIENVLINVLKFESLEKLINVDAIQKIGTNNIIGLKRLIFFLLPK